MRPGLVARMGVGGSGGAFDPLSLGPAVWYKPETLSALADNDPVSSWSDSSGNARNATNGSAPNRPLYRTAIQNGRPVVRFDGVNDQLTAAFTFSRPCHVFVVGVWRSATADMTILDGVSAVTMLVRQQASTRINIFGGADLNGPTGVTDVWRQYALVFNGASSEIRVDGGTATTGNAGANTSTGGVNLGARPGPSSVGAVDIGEVLIFPSVLGTTDRQAVEGYLRTRWGTA